MCSQRKSSSWRMARYRKTQRKLQRRFPSLGNWLSHLRRCGQIYSIDKAYNQVTTPFIFHAEDDWSFHRAPFIQPSFELLEAHPKIWTVSLYSMSCFGHPLVKVPEYPFQIQEPDWRKEGWGGMNFNPGLRRMKDYQEFGGSYGARVGYVTTGCTAEQTLSHLHLQAGFASARSLHWIRTNHCPAHRTRSEQGCNAVSHHRCTAAD